MDDLMLLAFIVSTWSVVLIASRKISVFPIFPVVPLVALGFGWLANEWIEWLGTGIAIAIHAGLWAIGAANARGK